MAEHPKGWMKTEGFGVLRTALAADFPMLRRLERCYELHKGLENLDLVGVEALYRSMSVVHYEAVARPEFYRRLKSSFVEAGVVPKGADARVINLNFSKKKMLEMYLDNFGLKVEVTVKEGEATPEAIEKPKKQKRTKRSQILMPIDDYGRRMQESDAYLQNRQAQNSREHVPG